MNIAKLLLNETDVWQRLKTCTKPVVLYGMGDGADKVLAAFERFGIEAAGVTASDDFVRGQSFRGFKVEKLSDIERRLGDFVIALCFASSLPDVTAHIIAVSRRHELVVPSVPVFGGKLFDDEFIKEYADEINAAYELFADDASKSVYKNILTFYRTGRLEPLFSAESDKSEAFENILRLEKNEIYVDLGAYNGDTIDEFLHYSGGEYEKIIALEPNPKNFKKLCEHCEGMKNIETLPVASYSKSTTLTFNNKSGRCSAIAESGVDTPAAAVDEILKGGRATYVKADVEGADFETLTGMADTMRKFKPKLNFSAYHRFEDIFRLALYIHGVNPNYRIYLRHHHYIPAWDTNLYCI